MPGEANTWEQLDEQTRYYSHLEEMDGIYPSPIHSPGLLPLYLRSSPTIIPLEKDIPQVDPRLQQSITFL